MQDQTIDKVINRKYNNKCGLLCLTVIKNVLITSHI